MNFLDIPEGESLFIDANVFVYAFAADPTLGPPCRDLVERIGPRNLRRTFRPPCSVACNGPPRVGWRRVPPLCYHDCECCKAHPMRRRLPDEQ